MVEDATPTHDVEGAIGQIERLGVHDAELDVKPSIACALPGELDRHGRYVYADHARPALGKVERVAAGTTSVLQHASPCAPSSDQIAVESAACSSDAVEPLDFGSRVLGERAVVELSLALITLRLSHSRLQSTRAPSADARAENLR